MYWRGHSSRDWPSVKGTYTGGATVQEIGLVKARILKGSRDWPSVKGMYTGGATVQEIGLVQKACILERPQFKRLA